MIIVTGAIEPRAEHFEEVLKLAHEHVARSRKEPGCIAHAVHIDGENPGRLVFFEKWADAAALKTHFAVPESGEFVRAAAKVSVHAPEIEIFEAAAVKI